MFSNFRPLYYNTKPKVLTHIQNVTNSTIEWLIFRLFIHEAVVSNFNPEIKYTDRSDHEGFQSLHLNVIQCLKICYDPFRLDPFIA
jgi:hypothetical protein